MEQASIPLRQARAATWLELAVAPEWRKQRCAVRIHAMGGERSECYVLSMDERWLCNSDGRLTVFRGFDAAVRFLRAVRVDDYQQGDALETGIDCDGSHYCLCVGRNDCLVQCVSGCRQKKTLDS